jgi:hypothetical protein
MAVKAARRVRPGLMAGRSSAGAKYHFATNG